MEGEPQLEMMDFDQLEFAMPETDRLLVASVEETKETTSKTKVRTAQDTKPRKIEHAMKLGSVGDSPKIDDTEVLAALGTEAYDPQASPRARGSAKADAMPDFLASERGSSMQTGMNLGGSQMGTAKINVAQPVLKDRAQIQQMIMRVLQSQLPRLRSCYESRLRSDSKLAGKWTLSFTLNNEGRTEKAKAVGQGMRDELLESCVVNKIDKWRFQPIKGTVPVKKTVTFDKR